MSTRYVWEKFNATYSLNRATQKSSLGIYGSKVYVFAFWTSSFSTDSGKIVMTESIQAQQYRNGDSFSGYYYIPTDDDEIGQNDVLEKGTVIPYFFYSADISIDDDRNYGKYDGYVSGYKYTVSNTLAQGSNSYGKVSSASSGAYPTDGSQ